MHFLIVLVFHMGWVSGIDLPAYKLIKQGNFVGLADENGTTIIYPQYENIGWSDGSYQPFDGVIGYQVNGYWGLMGLDEKKISSPVYHTLTPFSEGKIKVSTEANAHSDQLFGIISSKGKPLVAQQYSSIASAFRHLVVSQKSAAGIKFGLINHMEKKVIPLEYRSITPLNEQLLLLEDDQRTQWLTNYEGKKVLSKGVQEVTPLAETATHFTFRQQGKVGLLNALGELLVNPEYKQIELTAKDSLTLGSFGLWEGYTLEKSPLVQLQADDVKPILPGYIAARRATTTQMYTTRGTDLSSNDLEAVYGLESPLYLAKAYGKFGVSHIKTGVVIPANYDTIVFHHTHFYAKSEYWHVFNSSGKRLGNELIEEITLGEDDLTPVKVDGYWGFMSPLGNIAISCRFDAVAPFSMGKSSVKINGKYGMIDRQGNWEILPKYDLLVMVHKNLCIGVMEGIYRLVNSFGNTIHATSQTLTNHPLGVLEHAANGKMQLLFSPFDQPIDSISELQAGNFFIVYNGLKRYLLDLQGKVILSPKNGFEEIFPFSDELIGIKKDGKYGFVDWSGNLWIANQYEAIGEWKEGRGAVMLRGKWGFVDKQERLVVQPYYEEVSTFIGDVSKVRLGQKWGLVNNQGKEVLPVKYDGIEYLASGDYLVVQDNLYGLAKSDGRIAFQPIFEEVRFLGENLYEVKRNAQVGIKNRNNVDVLPVSYGKVRYDAVNKIIWGWKPTPAKLITIPQ